MPLKELGLGLVLRHAFEELGLELGLVLVLVLGLGLVVLHAFEELLIPLDHLVRVRG